MSPSQSDTSQDVGRRLIESGCRQGALIDAPGQTLWLTRPAAQSDWSISDEVVADAKLVVVSQDCDIFAGLKSEPRVEAITARWTSIPSEIHTARKGNSARLFLLQEGAGKALVADARRRVCLDKASLVGVRFEPAFRDDRSRLRFADWVAGRYNRPAIANELVDAVQKPVVVAVEALVKKKDALLSILDRVAELRFAVPDPKPSWTVQFFLMIDEGEELNVEEEAELAGWLEQVLVTSGGPIGTIAPLFRTEKTISLHDYLNTTRLQLDHFTPEEDPAPAVA